MRRIAGSIPTALVLTVLACAKPGASDDGQTVTTQMGTELGDTDETSSTSDRETDGPSETDTSDEEGGDFVPPDDLFGLCSVSELSVCDGLSQDCPEGEKCVPQYLDGCSYPHCVPITGDKPAGESCDVDEMAGDDCDADSWCYPGTFDLEQPGVCVSFCGGTYDSPSCDDPSLTCVFDQASLYGVLGCRPSCDPLMPEGCEPWERCTLGATDQPDFGCLLGGGVPDGEVCSVNQDCDSGACMAAESLLECAGERCCSPWCDLMAPSCAMGLECVPVDVEDPSSTVGVCSLP